MSTPDPLPDRSPDLRPHGGRPRWRPGPVEIAAIAVSALVLVGGLGAYLVGYFMAGDRLPKNAVISGVAVGGLTPAEAERTLSARLEDRAREPLELSVNGARTSIDPMQAGLRLDAAASVANAGGGRSFDPRHIWLVLAGGTATNAVVRVDPAALAAAVADVAAAVDRPAKDATLAYEGTKVVATSGRAGVELDKPETAARIQAGFLSSATPIETAAEVREPQISSAEAEQVATSFARPAVAAPVRLSAEGSKDFEVTPEMIAPALSFVARDGTLAPRLNAEALHRAAEPSFADADLDQPKNATVVIRDGKPTIVGGTNGVSITAAELARAVEPVLAKTGAARTATVAATTTPPEFTRADAQKLGITEVTGKFTTRFPYAEYRNHNIGRAGELINNTLLRPGRTFSLNKTLGERTRKNGYVKGYIIRDGRFRMELGGGVSQSATTTFNAAFFAGLEDVEHRPHGLYINRYPAGREATVYWPTLDLRFRNDTDYGVLVQARVVKATPQKQGRITVRMWSTKTYEKVASSPLRRSNFTSGPVIRDDQPDCEPQAPVQGFDVNYERLFYSGGEVVKRQKFFWRYKPTSRVVCV